jgi:hypothetical protein
MSEKLILKDAMLKNSMKWGWFGVLVEVERTNDYLSLVRF